MSRMKLIVALVIVAAVSAGAVVWLWKPSAGAGHVNITFNEVDPEKVCAVVCVNKTDKLIDSLGIKCSGEMVLTDSGGHLLTMMSAGSFDAAVPVGLQPGERRLCFKFRGRGQLEMVTAFAGKASSRHLLNEKVSVTGTLVLIFEPEGKIAVARE
jgi:hypothetical protein